MMSVHAGTDVCIQVATHLESCIAVTETLAQHAGTAAIRAQHTVFNVLQGVHLSTDIVCGRVEKLCVHSQ
jgi:hypothetical protein